MSVSVTFQKISVVWIQYVNLILFQSKLVVTWLTCVAVGLDQLQPCATLRVPLIPVLFVYVNIVVQPQRLSSGPVAMMSWYFLSSDGFGEVRAVCGWNSRCKMVLHAGEAGGRTVVCPGGAVLSTPLLHDWSRGGHSAASHPCHLAFPQRPAPVSRQMTWFDTPAGAIGPANVSARSSLEKKKVEKAISWWGSSFLFFFSFSPRSSLSATMVRWWGRLYCGRTKTHYSHQTSWV